MLKVSNKKYVRRLADKSFRALKVRNMIAILAIALTTSLFTALFTVGFSMNETFQQSNFRQVGGYSHGAFKDLTKEQYMELKEDPLIKEHGVRRVVGRGIGDALRKNHVEISWNDTNGAKWMWLDPIEGRLPKEGTNEAAADLEILKLLGVQPKIGEKFIVSMDVAGKQIEKEFTLCGWWEKDPICVANIILIPESKVDAILNEAGVKIPCDDKKIGTWQLSVMFSDARNIEDNLNTILKNHGYQSEDEEKTENYIDIGINWGYTSVQFSQKADPMTVFLVVILLLLITFTGYLIIYNIFRISVVNDIRFFGLLKTIGTTGKQIRWILRHQAIVLCTLGIPLGCIAGWMIGAKLNPFIIKSLNSGVEEASSASPYIFILSAVFALLTVLISCARPAKMAAKVSPVEAVRYIEGGSKKKKKKGTGKVSIIRMAVANLGRSKGKTFVTILSLTLAIVLLQITTLFTNGFDMEKYLQDKAVSDFILADGAYFQNNVYSWDRGESILEPRVVEEVRSNGGITDGGLVYGQLCDENFGIVEFAPKKWAFDNMKKMGNSEKSIEEFLKNRPSTEDGRVQSRVQTYGMEPYVLSRLKVYDGDLSRLNVPGNRTVAAVYMEDDYGSIIPESNWAKVGDTVTLRYVTEWEIYNLKTGETLQSEEEAGDGEWDRRPVTYRDETFMVDAVVTVPNTLSYRYSGADEFVMGADTFLEVNETDDIMLYAFDAENDKDMEEFLSEYIEKQEPRYNYESKESYQAEFTKLQNMFLLVGGLLSFIVGLVGILNFINVILTGIFTRKREFAMLQSIGMTGKQLKKMLVAEGILYAVSSLIMAILFTIIMGPVAASVLSKMFWFFTYRPDFKAILTVMPILVIMGVLIPLLIYQKVSKLTIVERLRDSES